MTITQLEPASIWQHFSGISAIPRPSKKEEKIIAYMENFGRSLGLDTTVDQTGNVIIKKDATPGMENRKTVVLQSHLDMVHQKNRDTEFDFSSEGIRTRVQDGWVTADGTTLGADNGIGVSAIMALLSSKDIPHPPLEALFTIDEETGMTGAKGLDPNILQGDILINLDSEEDDEITIGCAGGINTTTHYTYDQIKTPRDHIAFVVTVKGLKGGHSGLDIHLGRGNANKLLARFVHDTHTTFGLRIAAFEGGGLRNAIPREASAMITLPEKQKDGFQTHFASLQDAIMREFRTLEPDLQIVLTPDSTPPHVAALEDQVRMIGAIRAVFDGVFRMSPAIPDLVETSSNLARIEITDGRFRTLSLQRSSLESGKVDVVQTVRAVFDVIGASVSHDSDYPGWEPNRESDILRIVEETYTGLFETRPNVAACHAGVECGIIGHRYPQMDMVSIGPTIKHPHSPDEKVNIRSVQKFWRLLLEVLQKIPVKDA